MNYYVNENYNIILHALRKETTLPSWTIKYIAKYTIDTITSIPLDMSLL